MQPLMPNSLSPYPSCRKRFLYSNKKLILTEFFFNLFTIRNCRLLVTKYPQDHFTGNYGNTGSLLFFMLLYYQKHFLVQKYSHHICKCIMKLVFLMQNLNALVYYSPGKLREATFLLFLFCQLSITASLLSPFGNKISGTFKLLFNSLKYYIQKALKKEDGSQTGTFLLQVTVLAVVESFLRNFPEN